MQKRSAGYSDDGGEGFIATQKSPSGHKFLKAHWKKKGGNSPPKIPSLRKENRMRKERAKWILGIINSLWEGGPEFV